MNIQSEGEDTMQRSRLGSIFAVGAVAVGALLAQTAPIAHAMPIGEGTIKSECRSAGGVYQYQGGGFSTCTYTDYYGQLYRDYYRSGTYIRTD
jgi:hypothetical protein